MSGQISDQKQRYEITTYPASWHQRKAGHVCSSVMYVEFTQDELETYERNAKKHETRYCIQKV